MVWSKIDDGHWRHPKTIAAGNAAVGLWVRLLGYSNDQLTDGYIADAVVAMVGGAEEEIRALLDAGSLVSVAGGYQLHDFLEWNPARAEVLEQRALDARRKRVRRRATARGAIAQSRSNVRDLDGLTRAKRPPGIRPESCCPDPDPDPDPEPSFARKELDPDRPIYAVSDVGSGSSRSARERSIAELAADLTIEHRNALGNDALRVHSPAAWKAATVEKMLVERAEVLYALAFRPDPVEQLAQELVDHAEPPAVRVPPQPPPAARTEYVEYIDPHDDHRPGDCAECDAGNARIADIVREQRSQSGDADPPGVQP